MPLYIPGTAHLFISQQHLNQGPQTFASRLIDKCNSGIYPPTCSCCKAVFKLPQKPWTHQGTCFQSLCSFSIIWHKTNIVFCIRLQKSCPWNSSLSHPGGDKQQSGHLSECSVPPKGKLGRGKQCTCKTRGAEGKWVRVAGKYLLANLNTKESQAFLVIASVRLA